MQKKRNNYVNIFVKSTFKTLSIRMINYFYVKKISPRDLLIDMEKKKKNQTFWCRRTNIAPVLFLTIFRAGTYCGYRAKQNINLVIGMTFIGNFTSFLQFSFSFIPLSLDLSLRDVFISFVFYLAVTCKPKEFSQMHFIGDLLLKMYKYIILN